MSRWITQTTFYDPADAENPNKGNCTEASVASILGIPLTEVPGFHGPDDRFWSRFRRFFRERGFHAMLLPGNWVPETMYLAVGSSARGCNHMVVMRDGELLWDPHPSRAGLVSIEAVYLIVPEDPSVPAGF